MRFFPLLTLLKIECISEQRKRNTLPSLLLYLTSVYFILYQIQDQKRFDVENVLAMYWIIQLFVHVWLAFESMQAESRGRMLFWYQQISVSQFFGAKCVYNTLVTLILSNGIWALCQWVFLEGSFLSWQVVVLFSLMNSCFVLLFTFLAYMVFVLQKQLGLVSVLGLPLLIPTMMISMKIIRVLVLDSTLSSVSVWMYLPFYFCLGLLSVLAGIYLLPYLKND